ncbi:hypothetical protein D3C76_1765630 [compost metagenome]
MHVYGFNFLLHRSDHQALATLLFHGGAQSVCRFLRVLSSLPLTLYITPCDCLRIGPCSLFFSLTSISDELF